MKSGQFATIYKLHPSITHPGQNGQPPLRPELANLLQVILIHAVRGYNLGGVTGDDFVGAVDMRNAPEGIGDAHAPVVASDADFWK